MLKKFGVDKPSRRLVDTANKLLDNNFGRRDLEKFFKLLLEEADHEVLIKFVHDDRLVLPLEGD
jgi:hypothetical protein